MVVMLVAWVGVALGATWLGERRERKGYECDNRRADGGNANAT